MARSVLITGGSGYFGTVLAEQALARGDAVRIFDLNPPGPTLAGAEFVAGDVRDRDAVRAACDGVDVVFHNVAQVPLAKDRALFDAVNVGGTANVLVARARRARRQGRAHVVERGVRHPRAQPRDRGHAVPAARGLRPRQAAGRARCATTRSRPGSTSRSCGPARCSATAGSGVMALLFEFVADGAPVFVLGGGRQPVPARARRRSRRRVPARRAIAPGPSVYNVGALEFGTMRETLQALVDHAQTGSHVRSLPVAPARLAMHALASLGLAPFAPYHWLLYSESLYFDVDRGRVPSSAGSRSTRTRRW